MHFSRSTVYAVVAGATAVTAQLKGFSYGATNSDGSCRQYQDFVNLFNRAKSLAGAPGFLSARLYTSVQCGTTADPISAFQAAIDTDTSLMVGLWASAGSDAYQNDLNALLAGAAQMGNALTDRIIAISVGSEDLYRSSAQGVANNAGVGASASDIEGYIGWLRDWSQNTLLAGKPVGHVDTWTAWVLPENSGVVAAVDFLGHNSFPYFENTRPNAIENAADDFWSSLDSTNGVAAGKKVYVTETGWPYFGPTAGSAVPSTDNARTYWSQVGCSLFSSQDTYWYTLEDENPGQTGVGFGVTQVGSSTPNWDLSC